MPAFNYIIRFSLVMLGVNLSFVQAQNCTGATSFTINMSGRPDSVWTSSSVSRAGNCCSTANCVLFSLTLDSLSSGIKLEIISGSIPPGSLTYQIGCDSSHTMGQVVCLTGIGPHHITFCKPGHNANVYRITSLPKPHISGHTVVNEACTAMMRVTGYTDTTLYWESVPDNATYNTYLNCRYDCDTVYVSAGAGHPSTLTYRACGVVNGACSNISTCDTMSVQFVSNSSVSISPEQPVVCFGDATVGITASIIGGVPPYTYAWNNGDTSSNIQVGAGTFIVTATDSIGCMNTKDTVTVGAFMSPIAAIAGNDTSVCKNKKDVLLHGQVAIATGGQWSGGNGTFSPSSSQLTTTYSPSSTELSNGSVQLILTTTGNNGCLAVRDTLTISYLPIPPVNLNGPATSCNGKSETYQSDHVNGIFMNWQVDGGSIQSMQSDSALQVNWNQTGTGTISITKRYPNGCDSTFVKSVNVLSLPPVKTITRH